MSRKMASVLVVFLALFLITVPAWSANPGANTGPNGPGEDCEPVGDGPYGPVSTGTANNGEPSGFGHGYGSEHGQGQSQGHGHAHGYGHDGSGQGTGPSGPIGPADGICP